MGLFSQPKVSGAPTGGRSLYATRAAADQAALATVTAAPLGDGGRFTPGGRVRTPIRVAPGRGIRQIFAN